MTDAEQIQLLLGACDAYHKALDLAFAMLILSSREGDREMFLPSRSPMWPHMVLAKGAVDTVRTARRG